MNCGDGDRDASGLNYSCGVVNLDRMHPRSPSLQFTVNNYDHSRQFLADLETCQNLVAIFFNTSHTYCTNLYINLIAEFEEVVSLFVLSPILVGDAGVERYSGAEDVVLPVTVVRHLLTLVVPLQWNTHSF